jgi:hypothetical protein
MCTANSSYSGYVRIPEAALPNLQLEHMTSAIDVSIALPEQFDDAADSMISGYTEWVGNWTGAGVTIGWDWGFFNAQVVLLNVAEIRSNIQLLDPNGMPQSSGICRTFLASYLERLPWRDGAIRALIQRNSPGPR